MRELLFLEPVFKPMIWGGNNLHTEFGYNIPSDNTGECWAISAHPNGDCKIKNGTYKGLSLSTLWENKPYLFGNPKQKQFPLLIKIIDAKEDLSIQVHPDNKYAQKYENGSLGKTECWYILDCKENAEIIIGHYANTKQELEEMIYQKKFDNLVRKVPIHEGDFFQIEPGTIHAIKGGSLILETQQNSDITYRVYDYERLSDGKPRQLHTKQSIDVIKVPFEISQQTKEEVVFEDTKQIKLVSCDYYTVYKIEIESNYILKDRNSYCLVSIIDGKGTIDNVEVYKGDHFIVPYEYGNCNMSGKMECICSYPFKI